MKIKGLNPSLAKGLDILRNKYNLDHFINEIHIHEGSSLKIDFKDKVLNVEIKRPSDLFFSLGFVLKNKEKEVSLEINRRIENLTYMVDVSRNAVLKVETLKKLIEYLAIFGYNNLQLYTEDTFKMDDEPYFGYMRGAYSKEEINAVENYAAFFGIELVPCIQTLAHLNGIRRYGLYNHLFDTADILLVEEDATYEFIEKMIKTARESFNSNFINIGMDEAYMLGRGRYLDKHGLVPRFDIMVNHLKRVIEICKKYNFKPMMWSDMFFRVVKQDYYGDAAIPKEFLDKVPSEVELLYWDYYKTDEAHYLKMLDKHLQFNNPVSFAGGAWKWIGFTPSNRFTQTAAYAQMSAISKKKVNHFMVTSWGDNGNEASAFSVLPSLAYYGYLSYLDSKLGQDYQAFFEATVGISFDRFMLVDLANYLSKDVKDLNSANKHFLYNDILLGLMDTAVDKSYPKLYKKHFNKLKKEMSYFGEFKYLFDTQLNLLNVLSKKIDLGVKLRAAYKANDHEALRNIIKDLKTTNKLILVFQNSFKNQWFNENKAFGYEVQDLRIGGIKSRIDTAISKVEDYLAGKIESIEELEVDLLDYYGGIENHQKVKHIVEYRYLPIVSVGVNV
ncbi:beta-N-acetylhexosaminidase [Acholeplasma equirhinis]|uniref:beta-N-acetylhexosaminidase n=1 Tax=Acholeplasma equirhinis TaxID=555393 RepID=UPI00197AB052|nr:beta-N-acetylhexosaminidase [Acholeplasma equirhinis]MBN3491167.1 beta-N-acetylhexosaminidase [Acholeplasma equirhinis]